MRRFDPPLPMPVEPKLLVHGIEAKSCTMFQSAMCPLKLDFYTHSKSSEEEHKKHGHFVVGPPQIYSVIFKSGDDVR